MMMRVLFLFLGLLVCGQVDGAGRFEDRVLYGSKPQKLDRLMVFEEGNGFITLSGSYGLSIGMVYCQMNHAGVELFYEALREADGVFKEKGYMLSVAAAKTAGALDTVVLEGPMEVRAVRDDEGRQYVAIEVPVDSNKDRRSVYVRRDSLPRWVKEVSEVLKKGKVDGDTVPKLFCTKWHVMTDKKEEPEAYVKRREEEARRVAEGALLKPGSLPKVWAEKGADGKVYTVYVSDVERRERLREVKADRRQLGEFHDALRGILPELDKKRPDRKVVTGEWYMLRADASDMDGAVMLGVGIGKELDRSQDYYGDHAMTAAEVKELMRHLNKVR